jgi:hypothetical protein
MPAADGPAIGSWKKVRNMTKQRNAFQMVTRPTLLVVEGAPKGDAKGSKGDSKASKGEAKGAKGAKPAPKKEPEPQPEAEQEEVAKLETFVFKDDKKKSQTVVGRVLVEAADGGLLLLGQDGRLWTVEKPNLTSRKGSNDDFMPLSAEALGKVLTEEIGGKCDLVYTKHYVICSRAGKPYAQWCGALFERLYTAFHNYWKQRGLELGEPDFPLPALVFANEKQFAEFATKDAGPETATAKGYFSIPSNRMVIYDLTGGDGKGEGDFADRLAAAPFNIATVVHEATHQIAFNSGMHTRFADNPLWLTEGMAMYFETPDLTSKSGWKTVGAVNDLRFHQFMELSKRGRAEDSLTTLLQSDARFTDPKQMRDAYCEAWALCYFLIKTRKDDFSQYLVRLAEKSELEWDDPKGRLNDFQEVFGKDLKKIDADFVKYMSKVK